MKFSVKFTAGVDYAVDTDDQDVGLHHLDRARNELGSHIMEVSRVLPLREDNILTLTEEQARASGLFEHVSRVFVSVKRAKLNKYVEIAYRVLQRDCSFAESYYRVDSARLLIDWTVAGYPLTWDLA